MVPDIGAQYDAPLGYPEGQAPTFGTSCASAALASVIDARIIESVTLCIAN